MAVWRSRELEILFGGPLDDSGLTEVAFERIRDQGVAETDQLDFKRVEPDEVPYARNSPDARTGWLKEQEFAKDVAAFANHRGGVLLIGVGEDAATGVANMLTPVSVSTAAAEQQRLGQALLNFQAPLAEFYFVPVPAQDGGWYLAVVVPPSRRAPHAVLGRPRGDRHPLRYPVRHDRSTVWLNEHEVAERYRRRQSALEDDQNRLGRVVEDGRGALGQSSGVWLYAAAVPEFPIRDGRLDAKAVERITNWRQSSVIRSPFNRDLAFGRGTPAPGRVTFTDSVPSVAVEGTCLWLSRIELFIDGSVFAAKAINPGPQDGCSPHEVGSRTLADDLILLVDVGLRWCAAMAGSFGVATVEAGFVETPAVEGAIAHPLTLVSGGEGTEQAWKAVGTPKTAATADLSATETMQQRLAVVHLLHSGLLHWFGLRGVSHFSPDDPAFGSDRPTGHRPGQRSSSSTMDSDRASISATSALSLRALSKNSW